jgi:hypothetical protein
MMAIEAPVQELAISELLQLLFLSRRSGRLSLRETGRGSTTSLLLIDGWLCGVRGSGTDTRLGRLLQHAGAATAGQIDRAQARQRRDPGRLLGEILVRDEGVPLSAVQKQLRYQLESALFDLLISHEGHVRFQEERLPLPEVEVRLPTDALLLDAVRRIDEWTEITGAPAHSDPRPRLAAGAATERGSLTLQPLEWEVLGEVDGDRSLRAIARRVGRGEVEVARALLALMAAGVVDLERRPEKVRP